jgi:hypothetical protein
VGSFHWLIVIPFYFFGALTLLSASVLVTRIARLRVSINALVIGAILISVLSLAVPLSLDWFDLDALTGRRVAILLVASFIFAGVDAILKDQLPLPLDHDLEAED